MSWVVHKFGGTSLADSTCYRNCADIVLNDVDHHLKKCVVVSAMGACNPSSALPRSASNPDLFKHSEESTARLQKIDKVTSMLIRCQQLASERNTEYFDVMEALKKRHLDIVDQLISTKHEQSERHAAQNEKVRSVLREALEKDFEDLKFLLRAAWLGRTFNVHHWANGYGEIWSARLMSAFINFVAANDLNDDGQGSARRSSIFLDAREVVHILPGREAAVPDMTLSTEKLNAWFDALPERREAEFIVVTGYVASDQAGKPVTLGRDGSDHSASIMGALLDAKTVTIWTDVDGVYSANPNVVKQAVVRPELTYSEASEMAFFGAKVIHPQTMTPVLRKSIPIWLRNSFNPTALGSVIQSSDRMSANQQTSFGVKGFSCIENLSLISVEGCGMIGVPGTAHRLFGALRATGANVVLISQGGSEHSICLCVPEAQGPKGLAAVQREFRDEMECGSLEGIQLSGPVACLAIVGEGMKSAKGVAGRMLSALSGDSINCVAIAQGSSERNISVLVLQEEANKALVAVHRAFVEAPQMVVPDSPSQSLKSPKDLLARATALQQSIDRQTQELERINRMVAKARELDDSSNVLSPSKRARTS